ncbi:MAG: AraC family transcriptional regulator [Pseudomonadota bacterium]
MIRRQDMADALEEQCNALVRERLGTTWRRVAVLTAEQGTSTADRATDFHLLELCTSGQMQSQVDVESEAGDRLDVAIFPGTLHFLQSKAQVAYDQTGFHTLQQIHIDDAIFRDAAAALAAGDPDNLRPLAFAGRFDPRLKALADALLDEARAPSTDGDLYAEALAAEIALLILQRRYGPARPPSRRRKLSAPELARITEHMEGNLAETGGIDTLAALLDMGTFAFTRAFKATTGQAPHQYLIDRRMGRIKDMLAHGDEPLVEIAYATGFSSQSHMTAAFTRRMGVAPGKWRAAVRETIAAVA